MEGPAQRLLADRRREHRERIGPAVVACSGMTLLRDHVAGRSARRRSGGVGAVDDLRGSFGEGDLSLVAELDEAGEGAGHVEIVELGQYAFGAFDHDAGFERGAEVFVEAGEVTCLGRLHQGQGADVPERPGSMHLGLVQADGFDPE